MKRLFISLLLIFSTSACTKTIKEEHRLCEVDKDCKVIGRGGCCATDDVVNKKFSIELALPTEERCHSIRMQCNDVKAICEKKRCKIMNSEVLKCETSEDCVIIGRGGCCGTDTVVNKKYAKDFALPADKRCEHTSMLCDSPKAICLNRRCRFSEQGE